MFSIWGCENRSFSSTMLSDLWPQRKSNIHRSMRKSSTVITFQSIFFFLFLASTRSIMLSSSTWKWQSHDDLVYIINFINSIYSPDVMSDQKWYKWVSLSGEWVGSSVLQTTTPHSSQCLQYKEVIVWTTMYLNVLVTAILSLKSLT